MKISRSFLSSLKSRLQDQFMAGALTLILLILFSSGSSLAQSTYRQPPKEVLDVLNAPPTPTALISPTRDYMVLAQGVRYPPIAELAEPMLRLAGLRINPVTNGPHRAPYFVKLWLKRISDGTETPVTLPPDAHIRFPQWSGDGKRFAFLNTTASGIELWVADTATGKAHALRGLKVNDVFENVSLQWMPDNRTLLAELVPAKRGAMPPAQTVPQGPDIQESSGKPAPVRTFEDMLTSAHDEDLFDYYATAQLALVDAESGRATPIGQPAIFETIDPAPDGQHILVARLHRPYSYLLPFEFFPKEVEVWDRNAKVIYKVASLPLADQVPIEGVPTGPRDYHWRPTTPTTLVWVEALDQGDPRKKVSPRDRVLMLTAPFTEKPVELFKTEQRFNGLQWGERDGLALISDYDRNRRWRRTFALNADNPFEHARLVWERNINDQYNNPGTPLLRVLPTGQRAILQYNNSFYLTGTGASQEGDRPFLDRLNWRTLKTEHLYRSQETSYEAVVTLLHDDASQVVMRRESPTEPPNYFIYSLDDKGGLAKYGGALVFPLTKFPDPTPQLRGIKKQLVTYKRADGVQCSFTLYLPPNYKEGTRLPTVVWAYPLEYTDPSTASQVTGSAQRFTTIAGPSQLFFLLEGYAVLDNATMPVVGDPETMNNTYIEQIVMSAKAAIDKAAEMGVTDPDRVGVGGHSYGAFMTANLLAHSDLFRAGIARSGAYNRTLTPFGFQSERRTIWEAPELYMKVSPFLFADKIKAPLLMIHGEADDNSGTFPIQSERMYQAVSGNGGTVRLVMLPLEAHGYAARETIEHVLYEMITWFDKYVKNAPPRVNREKTAAN